MSQARLLAVLLWAPALLTGAGIVGVEAWRALQPEAALFAPPPTPSLASALEWGELPQAAAHLAARDDPWAPLDVHHSVLTGDRPLRVSPLLWAVATGNADGVRMLVGLGVPLDTGVDRQAACLADAMGRDDIAALLRAYAVPPDEPCRDLATGEPPLVALVTGAG